MANKWTDKPSEADGFIIVSPEYNHGYPAVLKNALDYAYSPWNKKPVGFVSYGSTGGAKVIEQLRQVAVELQMAPIQRAVQLMKVHEIFDEKGKMKDDSYDQAVNAFLDQLTWWGNALKTARDKTSSS